MRSNLVTDDGARAIAALLSAPNVLSFIDLKGNRISRNGLKAIAAGLEKSDRVNRIVIRPGGRIEAIASKIQETTSDQPFASIDTVCTVDVRDNSPPDDPLSDVRSLVMAEMTSSDDLSKRTNQRPRKVAKSSSLRSPLKEKRRKEVVERAKQVSFNFVLFCFQ